MSYLLWCPIAVWGDIQGYNLFKAITSHKPLKIFAKLEELHFGDEFIEENQIIHM